VIPQCSNPHKLIIDRSQAGQVGRGGRGGRRFARPRAYAWIRGWSWELTTPLITEAAVGGPLVNTTVGRWQRNILMGNGMWSMDRNKPPTLLCWSFIVMVMLVTLTLPALLQGSAADRCTGIVRYLTRKFRFGCMLDFLRFMDDCCGLVPLHLERPWEIRIPTSGGYARGATSTLLKLGPRS
jgi:hypothetical protein